MANQPPLLPFISFPANPPTLPVWSREKPGQPDAVVRADVTAVNQQALHLRGETRSGRTMQITVQIAAPGVAHVLLEEHPDPQRVTLARPYNGEAIPVRIDRFEDKFHLETTDLQMQIQLDPFHLTFYDAAGRVLLDQNPADADVVNRLTVLPFGLSEHEGRRAAFHDTFWVEPDEHYYGFGEKFTELDKRGQILEMWNYDALGVHSERAYKNVPFFLSTHGYGLLVDSVRCVRFDVAHSNHAALSVIVPDSALDYYVITASDLKGILTRYARLVSFPSLPPKWALGLWVSSGFKADSAGELLQRARELHRRQVPCDVLHLDAHWQRFGCWSDLLWDRERFPDPAGLLAQIKALGFKVSLWMNPYLGIRSERFTEAKEAGYLLRTESGEPFVADLWSGDHPPVWILDMTNPSAVAWFQDLLRSLLRMGVDVFKTDFGEGVPLEARAHNGMTGEQLHNLYSLLYNDAVAEVTRQETGRAGLVWARSSYAGGQRHTAQWGGDPNCTFPAMASTLRGGLSFGLSGHAFWSHDIGGFHGEPSPEVYIRWAQFGLFSPLARLHGTTSRLPWDFGLQAFEIVRRFLQLRYRLLPYLYTCAQIAAETGVPILRAMVLDFPNDPLTYHLDLQYLFGEDFLVAPIYNHAGERPVYFPTGGWVDFWSHKIIYGPQTRQVRAPIDQLPLYVRLNALIPTIEPQLTIPEGPFEKVTFDAYLSDSGSGELHDLDGVTRVTANRRGTDLLIEMQGGKPAFMLRLLPLPGLLPVHRLFLNGQELSKIAGEGLGWKLAADGSFLVRLAG